MKKILVIDDEMSLCELIKDYLDEEGYRTFIATTAASGLALAKKEAPDLVMLDILMPEVGGLECLKRIKQMNPETIVVVVSGIADEEIARQAIRRGAFDYIHKPFNLRDLQERILDRIFCS